MSRNTAVTFLVAESCAIAVWWLGLVVYPQWRVHFNVPDAPDMSLLAFAFGDLGLLLPTAVVAAVGIGRREPWGWWWLLVHTGAAAYATLYTLGVFFFSRGESWAGAAAMLPMLTGLVWISWGSRPNASVHEVCGLLGRVASDPSPRVNALKTAAQIVVIWGVFLFLIPWLCWRLEQHFGFEGWQFGGTVKNWFAVALFACASVVGLSSSYVMVRYGEGTPFPFDAARRLVVRGPYRFVRNPMALAGILQGVSVAVFLGSPFTIAYALAGAPFWNYLIRPWEERDLERRLGAEYRAYRDAVNCWWPRRRPFVTEART
ncbi:MAG: methyltransferase family protein [Planctomycetota bacterium]